MDQKIFEYRHANFGLSTDMVIEACNQALAKGLRLTQHRDLFWSQEEGVYIHHFACEHITSEEWDVAVQAQGRS